MFEPAVTPTSETPPTIGSYRLAEPLGSGGMSSVFRALHVVSGHEVAVKILPRALAQKSNLLRRFLREAKSVEALEHPNIVAIFDRGVSQGKHYLVLEYLPGGDLHRRVREQGPLSAEETVAVLKAVAEGLRYASAKGLIHRDIKPANLLLDADGHVKITDLGLALMREDEDEQITRDGTTVGTVDYMAPEQARDSRATSVRSDIYSLGCTAFFLLSGQPPFPGGGVADKLRSHVLAPPPDVRSARRDVPPALARLIQRMMAKSPDERLPDHDALIRALERIDLSPNDEMVLVPLEEDEEVRDFAIIDEEPASSTFEATVATAEPVVAHSGLDLDELEALAGSGEHLVPRRASRGDVARRDVPVEFLRPRSVDADLKSYIVIGLIVGLTLVLVVSGLFHLATFSAP